jgi:hypothetical protein
MRSEMGGIRSEMREMREELKRHTDVKFESVRDDIRMLAEGLGLLSQTVESMRGRFDR